MTRAWPTVLCVVLLCGAISAAPQSSGPGPGRAQNPGRQGRPSGPPELNGTTLPQNLVVKVREGLYRIGPMEVDTVRREVRVPGAVNPDVTTLEFVASTRGGNKAYESALSLDVNGVFLNTALLLLGLNPDHAVVPKTHFDPKPPKGDAVEISLEWQDAAAGFRSARVEDLLYDKRSRTTMAKGPWVYTGSTISNGRFLADIDGVLIGFVHSPAPLIENPRSGAVNAYGEVVLNTSLGLKPGTRLFLIIRAIASPKGQ